MDGEQGVEVGGAVVAVIGGQAVGGPAEVAGRGEQHRAAVGVAFEVGGSGAAGVEDGLGVGAGAAAGAGVAHVEAQLEQAAGLGCGAGTAQQPVPVGQGAVAPAHQPQGVEPQQLEQGPEVEPGRVGIVEQHLAALRGPWIERSGGRQVGPVPGLVEAAQQQRAGPDGAQVLFQHRLQHVALDQIEPRAELLDAEAVGKVAQAEGDHPLGQAAGLAAGHQGDGAGRGRPGRGLRSGGCRGGRGSFVGCGRGLAQGVEAGWIGLVAEPHDAL